jgi:hypothetical protein
LTDPVTIRRRSELLEAEVGGELVALDVESGTCYGFNPTATRIWALLSEPKTLDEICDHLTGEFEIDRDTCRSEVLELVRDLEKDGLVEIGGAPAAG